MFPKQWIFRRRKKRTSRTSLTIHYQKHRSIAEHIIRYKVHQWNAVLQLQHGRITIRNQRSRWGSCSGHGNLNFNYKLIFLPEHLLDYVVVHELCHLQELNHSQDFWALVEDVLPAYRNYKYELRTYERAWKLDDRYLQKYRSIIDMEPQR